MIANYFKQIKRYIHISNPNNNKFDPIYFDFERSKYGKLPKKTPLK